MNAPPLPPRPTPDEAPPPVVVTSLPPPSRAPVISIRVPSGIPGAPAAELPAPAGAQLVVPGRLMPIARVLATHSILVIAIVVAGVLAALRIIPPAAFLSIASLILGIQLPSIPIREAPTIYAVQPPAADAAAAKE